MNRKSMLKIGIAMVWLVVIGGLAISAQDKYNVKVPGGLAFSEFRGYEAWQAISISGNAQGCRCDPWQSRDDRRLPGWHSRQW
jgi:hypothetical protein